MTGPTGLPPLVAVSGRRRLAAGAHDGPSQLDTLEVEVYFAGYADRLAAAGAVPVHVPAAVDPRALVERVDALVLTGGSDVDPALYGEPALPGTRVDRERDDRELALLAAALHRGLPVLAICRGMQLLNVHLGGTLHQHLTDHPLGRDGAHPVAFTPGSTPERVYGGACSPAAEGRHYPVNSLHHQAVDRLGAGLVAVGHAPDGIVEAVELPGFDVVGVQWHPEQLTRPDPVFAWLVTAAVSAAAGTGVPVLGERRT